MRQKTTRTDRLNYFNNFKVKMDIKETGVNPYVLPFNYQVLLEKQ